MLGVGRPLRAMATERNPMSRGIVTVLGCFNADLVFEGAHLPALGETVMGRSFAIHPGGKGSNQAIAARRAGADVRLISALGRDSFGDMARTLYAEEGIDDRFVIDSRDSPTGTAFIFVDQANGENAILVGPGAATRIGAVDLDNAEDAFRGADVFMAQNEVPLAAVIRGFELARRHGVTTIYNPAPAVAVPDSVLALADFMTPNRTEAAALAGFAVTSYADAERAAATLCTRGAGCTIVTLGAEGAVIAGQGAGDGAPVGPGVRGIIGEGREGRVPAFDTGPAVDTTGAGDAFNGAFAAALAAGLDVAEAVRWGCAAGSIAVTRPGAARSMPRRGEIEAMVAGKPD